MIQYLNFDDDDLEKFSSGKFLLSKNRNIVYFDTSNYVLYCQKKLDESSYSIKSDFLNPCKAIENELSVQICWFNN